MDIKTLKKAQELSKKINECERNLDYAKYTQSENVVERESIFKFNGVENYITVPKTLFKIIGKLIESEYTQELNNLKKEFEEL